jgi:hypothetical protein
MYDARDGRFQETTGDPDIQRWREKRIRHLSAVRTPEGRAKLRVENATHGAEGKREETQHTSFVFITKRFAGEGSCVELKSDDDG